MLKHLNFAIALAASLLAVTPTTAAEAAPEPIWIPVKKKLPAGKLSDRDGRPWNLADPQPMITLVVIWASWCKPCIEELAHLSELEARIGKERARIVTLNLDEDHARALEAIREAALAYPVIWGRDYFMKVDGSVIPRSWILDRRGSIRYEARGWQAHRSAAWADQATWAIDALK
jgi:thiol-disulfide isomerase/thioredoxin